MSKHLEELIFREFQHLIEWEETLASFDHRIRVIAKPIAQYCKSVNLNDLDKPCYTLCKASGVLTLNKTYLSKIIEKVPPAYLKDAVMLFTFHEISHISQGFEEFYDVVHLKLICGSSRMSQFDLKSDFIAAHTLSLLRMVISRNIYDEEVYMQYLYKFWCKIGRLLSQVFPTDENRGKQQRFLGSLIMSHLIHKSYSHKTLLEFSSELWPEWNNTLDYLIIFEGDGKIWKRPSNIDPLLMRNILTAIASGRYDSAFQLSSQLLE